MTRAEIAGAFLLIVGIAVLTMHKHLFAFGMRMQAEHGGPAGGLGRAWGRIWLLGVPLAFAVIGILLMTGTVGSN